MLSLIFLHCFHSCTVPHWRSLISSRATVSFLLPYDLDDGAILVSVLQLFVTVCQSVLQLGFPSSRSLSQSLSLNISEPLCSLFITFADMDNPVRQRFTAYFVRPTLLMLSSPSDHPSSRTDTLPSSIHSHIVYYVVFVSENIQSVATESPYKISTSRAATAITRRRRPRRMSVAVSKLWIGCVSTAFSLGSLARRSTLPSLHRALQFPS